MSHHPFGARQTLGALIGLDFGLRVHVDVRPSQRAIFPGPENLSVQHLTSKLAEMISSLRVYSYVLRRQLERVTSALQLNVECGSWRYARRAALDLADLLAEAHTRHRVKGTLAEHGVNCALRIAELCSREVR